MPLRIDRVESQIEIQRKPDDGAATDTAAAGTGSTDLLGSQRGRAEMRERLRPIVLEILNDELERIKRKVGAP